jgi:hypothetical protein
MGISILMYALFIYAYVHTLRLIRRTWSSIVGVVRIVYIVQMFETLFLARFFVPVLRCALPVSCSLYIDIFTIFLRVISSLSSSGFFCIVDSMGCFIFRHHCREKRLLPSSCQSVCPRVSARLPLGGFSWNLVIGFYENLSRKAKGI